MPPRRKKSKTRRRARAMIRVMPALEAYMTANVATQNLFGGNPIQFLLGDLNAQGGTGALAQAMGPQPGVISVKELLTGTMNTSSMSQTYSMAGGKPTYTTTYATSATAPLDAVAQNFQNNLGNIVIGSVMTTAGFRIANKVLSKPKRKFNAMLRQAGLGTTVQI